jgi:hypothetical protein
LSFWLGGPVPDLRRAVLKICRQPSSKLPAANFHDLQRTARPRCGSSRILAHPRT